MLESVFLWLCSVDRHLPVQCKQCRWAVALHSCGLSGQSLRGQPYLVQHPTAAGKYYMLSNASTTEAVYRAHERAATNPYVKQSVLDGLQSVRVYKAAAPRDVCEWLKERHNSKHHGARTSVFEFMKKVLNIEAEFLVTAKQRGVTARDGDGEASYRDLYLKFVQDWVSLIRPSTCGV